MSSYNVTITNGQGTANMKAGTYTVSATEAQGYDVTTLSPTSFTATSQEGSGTFTLSATGTLTFVVNETGAQGGTPITSGSIIMTDSTGTTQYGTAVEINSNGEAVFNNVPHGTSETSYVLYFKQLATDEGHNIYEDVISVSMQSQTQTEYVLNTEAAEQTITLTDANYAGLPIDNATLNFSDE